MKGDGVVIVGSGVTLSRYLGMGGMTLSREDYEAIQRRAQDDFNEIGTGVAFAMAGPVIWLLGRFMLILTNAPGKDVNFDGVFSITDIWLVARYVFHEPAYVAIGFVPPEFWRFFETTAFELPPWLLLLAGVAAWIAIAVGLFIAGRYVAKAFGYLGRGAQVGIGRVQMRLPQLMATDIVIIAVVIVVFGGFAIATLINSLG